MDLGSNERKQKKTFLYYVMRNMMIYSSSYKAGETFSYAHLVAGLLVSLEIQLSELDMLTINGQ